jgi:hypothetical protein
MLQVLGASGPLAERSWNAGRRRGPFFATPGSIPSTYRNVRLPARHWPARTPNPTILMKTTSTILATAVTGLFLGGTFGCASTKPAHTAAAQPASDKHACATLNSCKGQGGCSTGDQGCAGKNSCKGKGGCATVDHHSCGGMNACKGQGGCKTAEHACAGKNSCEGKGGCHVPVKKS